MPNHSLQIYYLNISNCGLSYISSHMFQPPTVILTADFSNNNLGAEISKDINGTSLAQLNVVHGKVINLSSNNIRQVPKQFFSRATSLEQILLRDNNIDVWQTSISNMPNLTLLDLSFNQIPFLETGVCDEMDKMAARGSLTLDLGENPLVCDCYSREFTRWLYNTNVVIRKMDNYTCLMLGEVVSLRNISGVIQKLDIRCHGKTWVVVAGVSCALLVILMVVSVVIYRHRWDVRYCCLKFTRQRQQYEVLTDERHFQFDAFVAYHQDELKWIQRQLIPNLERRPDALNLCIHHRNWLPGPTIEENISFSVENSRKTLVLLTESFRKSGWCEFEVEMARVRGLEEGASRSSWWWLWRRSL